MAMIHKAMLPLCSSRRVVVHHGAQNSFNVCSRRTPITECNVSYVSSSELTASSSSRLFSSFKPDRRIGDAGCGHRSKVRQPKMLELRAGGYGAEERSLADVAVEEVTDEDLEKEVLESDMRVLAAVKSRYNYITVLEIAREADHLLAGARMLLLDNPTCIHSVYYRHKVLTNSYYDVFATFVPLLPNGPVGLLGLGAGAAAHILHHFYPALEMHGWELDLDIITIARQFFDLSKLEEAGESRSDNGSTLAIVEEKQRSSFTDQSTSLAEGDSNSSTASGKLTVHVGDALGPSASLEGGFAGLIVDLFAEGRVVPALQKPQTWQELKDRLRPGGRIIVNCGGARAAAETETKSAGQLYMEETIAAMGKVFGGNLSTTYLARKGFNTLAITGPFPDIEYWDQALPKPLRDGVSGWNSVF